MSVIGWLLDGDPAIRWQVPRDLTDAPAGEVAAERARVERDGWGGGEEYLLQRGPFRRKSTAPSRWNTLRALRVLKWWDGSGNSLAERLH